jgi:phage terminase large subunit
MATATQSPTNLDVWFPPKLEGFLFAPGRYKVAYGGRGSAKSWSIARALLLIGKQPDLLWPGWSEECRKQGIGYENSGIRILCYRETMRSIEESVHQLLTDQIRLLRLGDFYHVQQKNIVGKNGTEFFFAGVRQSVDNLKSYEGVHIAWGSQSEAMSKRSLNVVFPTLRRDISVGDKKYGSELWFDFNPEFEDDEIYKLFAIEANRPQDCQVKFINWHDNPFFPEVLRKEREDLMRRDPDECQHVYEGTTRSSVEGAIYKNELRAAEMQGRLSGRVPYDPTHAVDTYWDIGPAHTRIWLAQSFPFEYRIIDYIAGELESLAFYVKLLKEREYHYGVHTLPWDGAAKELGSGRSIQEQLRAVFGRDRVRCAKQLSVEDGIAAVRAILPKCYFDHERCNVIEPRTKQQLGIRGLRCYQYEYDKDLRTYSRKPLHDWASHDADAFRTLATTIKEQVTAKRESSSEPAPRIGVWS